MGGEEARGGHKGVTREWAWRSVKRAWPEAGVSVRIWDEEAGEWVEKKQEEATRA